MLKSAISTIPESYPSHLRIDRGQTKDAIQTVLQFPEATPVAHFASEIKTLAQHELVSTLDEDFSDDDTESHMPSIPHYTGTIREIPEQLSRYVYDFLNIFYTKVEEFGEANGVNALNDSDNDICFEQACNEYNKMYPGFEKNNARVFELAREHI